MQAQTLLQGAVTCISLLSSILGITNIFDLQALIYASAGVSEIIAETSITLSYTIAKRASSSSVKSASLFLIASNNE